MWEQNGSTERSGAGELQQISHETERVELIVYVVLSPKRGLAELVCGCGMRLRYDDDDSVSRQQIDEHVLLLFVVWQASYILNDQILDFRSHSLLKIYFPYACQSRSLTQLLTTAPSPHRNFTPLDHLLEHNNKSASSITFLSPPHLCIRRLSCCHQRLPTLLQPVYALRWSYPQIPTSGGG